MVYQVSKSNDNEYSYLTVKEVKPNSKTVLSGISRNRSRSTGRPKTSVELSKRRSLSRSRSKGATFGEKKTTRTKRSISADARRPKQSRPLGVTVAMSKSSSSTEKNRSTRDRSRTNNTVRTRALSADRPQSRRKSASERPLSRGRSRAPSRQNSTRNPSTNGGAKSTMQTEEEKEMSAILSSIKTSESTTAGPKLVDNDCDEQLDSDILMKEKIANKAKMSCNAIDDSMLRVESSIAGCAFSCSDKLSDLMTAIQERVSSFCKCMYVIILAFIFIYIRHYRLTQNYPVSP